jgi:hypothetical protein
VLALARDGSIVPYESETALARCNARAFWRNRYYDDLFVFDADARAWRADGARLLTPVGSAGRFLARLTNGRMCVELAWRRHPHEDGLNQARSAIEGWLGRDVVFWEASADMEEWVARVRRCLTMSELLSVFR